MIKIYNRKTKAYDVEQVAGLKYINWSYASPIGKSFLELFIKKKMFSKLYGNFCIRPVLKDTDSQNYSVSLSPSSIINTDEDATITCVSDCKLFNISNSDNRVLYQDTDYELENGIVTLKKLKIF